MIEKQKRKVERQAVRYHGQVIHFPRVESKPRFQTQFKLSTHSKNLLLSFYSFLPFALFRVAQLDAFLVNFPSFPSSYSLFLSQQLLEQNSIRQKFASCDVGLCARLHWSREKLAIMKQF